MKLASILSSLTLFVMATMPVNASATNESVPKGLTQKQEDNLLARRREIEKLENDENWQRALS